MRRLITPADMEEGLAALVRSDPRLAAMAACTGPVALRHRPPGFEGVARIVVAQMLSVASANAIWTKLESRLNAVSVETLLSADEPTLRQCGLSGAKIRTLRATADAVRDGLDLVALADAPPEDAVKTLTALPGIGVWTAEIFLLFCARHADIFPAGDLALQLAAAEGLGLEARPSEKEMRRIAAAWSPWRGVSAKLLWAYYSWRRENRDSLPA